MEYSKHNKKGSYDSKKNKAVLYMQKLMPWLMF
ncbi:hypothetical protein NC653_038683 [Populus alba x Populus x berolinensis]|uniref:Uncharacterized protein n=1 Tax=Populus alba x Populus x berolinensis TaxID=444605 RepID=A0AAD6LHC5_9ROSI|nr:hypothetical protein NC653_038683 [Populus alba x Populus x berolinensis]